MKKILLTSILACFMVALSAISASAQSPVKWTATTKMTSAKKGVVTLTANIDKGWHVYGTQMPEDGPSPTKFSFTSKGVKFTSKLTPKPSPKKEMDSQFGTILTFWENTVTFTRKFTVTDAANAEIKIDVTYMCCNDSSCRPPKTETFVLKIGK